VTPKVAAAPAARAAATKPVLSAAVAPAPSNQKLAREKLIASGDWTADFRWLDASMLDHGERLFLQAVILESCSNYEVSINMEGGETAAAIRAGNLDRAIARAMEKVKDDRQRQAMEYAVKRKVWNICRGFAGSGLTRTDVEEAYAAAAAAGNAAAQARVIAARLAESALTTQDSLTPEEHRQLLGALFSGDPLAIRFAGGVLSLGSNNQSLRIGDLQVDLGHRAETTWLLVACEFGFECGARNMFVNTACAEQRRCAEDYRSYIQEYLLSPADYAAVTANAHAIAEAIRRRDVSAFQLVQQPGMNRTIMGSIPPRVFVR
jgi:hypothetical protein